MKTRFFWAYIIVLVFSPFVIASPDRDDMKYTDGKVKKVRDEWVESHNKLVEVVDEKTVQIKELQASVNKSDKVLNNRIEELQASVNELQAKVESLWEKGATIGRKGDKTDIKANVALWITIPIVMVICGVLGFAFWPRKSKSVPVSAARSDQRKCPRCGWEHDPSDTVCKNPNCKTQF